MIESFLIESVISLLVNQIGYKIFQKPEDRARFDFVFQNEDNQTIAIEVKTGRVGKDVLKRISNSLNQSSGIDIFYLITTEEPSDDQKKDFNSLIVSGFKDSIWISFNEFLKIYNIDIDNNEDLNNLQLAGITSQIQKYSSSHIGNNFFLNNINNYKLNYDEIKKGNRVISTQKLTLQRQLPTNVINRLPEDKENIEQSLYIGVPYDNAVIVLTDIKFFQPLFQLQIP